MIIQVLKDIEVEQKAEIKIQTDRHKSIMYELQKTNDKLTHVMHENKKLHKTIDEMKVKLEENKHDDTKEELMKMNDKLTSVVSENEYLHKMIEDMNTQIQIMKTAPLVNETPCKDTTVRPCIETQKKNSNMHKKRQQNQCSSTPVLESSHSTLDEHDEMKGNNSFTYSPNQYVISSPDTSIDEYHLPEKKN